MFPLTKIFIPVSHVLLLVITTDMAVHFSSILTDNNLSTINRQVYIAMTNQSAPFATYCCYSLKNIYGFMGIKFKFIIHTIWKLLDRHLERPQNKRIVFRIL
jgi:hypothetical protein